MGGVIFQGGLHKGTNIGRVVLMRGGSVTHSFDTDQRLIQLDIVSSAVSKVTVRAPYSPAAAPPGDYMLFALRNSTSRRTGLQSHCFRPGRRAFESIDGRRRLGQCMSGPIGRRTVKTDPLPASLVTVTSPPIMRASLREMARPSPVPP
jgi:hypothetical protein